ncbi:MAG: hypothetical protein JST00_06375 [Deltaproteobacteria bacterium]|nr:hypothetical protein [Deltaproteobacteria bacterium]
MHRRLFLLFAATGLVVVSSVAACGSDGTSSGGAALDGGTLPDAPSGTDDASAAPDADAASPCVRTAKDADRARKVVVSHPFLAAGQKGKKYEVLELSAAGALTRPGTTFEMGTGLDGEIVFTPDGEIGLVPQDDGTVGIFRFDGGGTGAPIVIDGAFKGDFYAGRVIMHPTGTRAFVLDANTQANGGGVYELSITCEGKVTSKGLVVPGGTANAMAYLPGDPKRAVLAAGKAFASPAGADVHVVDLDALALVSSGTAFSTNDAIPSSLAVTTDKKYALVADNGPVVGNRVSVVALDTMKFVQMLPTEFPAKVLASVHGNAALVLNDDSTDELTVLGYDAANATTPFTNKGRVAYKFPKPQIPVSAVQILRGALAGRVILGENTAVRQVQFMPDGSVVDTAQTPMGSGIPEIVGVVGVQP